MRHHAAAEDRSIPDYRGDCGVARVLRRVKRNFSALFIKNVIKKRPFKGVIGVACPLDLNLAMMSLENYCPQGVYLLRDGCINTIVNVDEVIDLINVTQPETEYKAEDFN